MEKESGKSGVGGRNGWNDLVFPRPSPFLLFQSLSVNLPSKSHQLPSGLLLVCVWGCLLEGQTPQGPGFSWEQSPKPEGCRDCGLEHMQSCLSRGRSQVGCTEGLPTDSSRWALQDPGRLGLPLPVEFRRGAWLGLRLDVYRLCFRLPAEGLACLLNTDSLWSLFFFHFWVLSCTRESW